MSKLKYILSDFVAAVPSCVQTTPTAVVLQMLSSSQGDRLVVLNQQQYPIGVIYVRRLLSQLMPSSPIGRDDSPIYLGNVQQSLSELATGLVEPVDTLPAELSLEKFKLYLHSHQQQINTECEWALIDADGKFLGLLESNRLWKFLALQNAVASENKPHESLDEILPTSHSIEPYKIEPYKIDLLVQLLERLPLPLMLQTGKGEVISQNPAWCQQFGALSNPEAVRREVEAILQIAYTPIAEVNGSELRSNFGDQQNTSSTTLHSSNSPNTTYTGGDSREVEETSAEPPLLKEVWRGGNPVGGLDIGVGLSRFKLAIEQSSQKSNLPGQQLDYTNDATGEPESAEENKSSGFNHCQLGSQPGTCICVWPGENGQDRVWRFLKIPLLMSAIAQQFEPEQIWILLATDVTEQQQMASELAAKNADLIQLNRLKDEFLACISHELRTPLTAMLGLSTLLKDQALGQLNERQARYARLIYENGRHLMSVVNDILDLTRMETGQLELTLEPAQIRKVCDRAIEQARAAIQPKTSQPTTTGETGNSPEHSFTLLIEPGLDIIVVDELRLRQMLVHLLANAFKFTELEGDIGLRVSYWAGWIAFTVWDTGIGIPEHQQHLIFQKFQQLENPLTRQFEGTGLGLVLTRTLARLHGGDVSFLSKEGKGSQFTLLLPPSPPHKRPGEQRGRGAEENSSFHLPPPTTYHSFTPNSSHENRRNDLVLVVEAVPRFIEDLADQLTSLGYWVVIARSGTEALEKARRLQPGTIFLNPLLPLLSGWDVLTLLKSDAATSQIPVIVTTTRAEKAQALSHRADEFLSLPVKQQVLQQVMTGFCGSPSVSRSSVNLSRHANNDNQLTILRLVTPQSSCTGQLPFALTHASLLHCRVLEADDIEQAELLARIWQPDVVLLEREILDPLSYLQQLSEKPSLAELPIVTLDVATTQAANQVEGLSVFPCLTTTLETSEALLSVLQIAAGISREYGVLVVDVTPIEEPEKPSSLLAGVKTPGYAHSSDSIRSEWLQALIQYLHKAGFRGVMAHSWEEVQQQIQQQSVDVILICLGESKLALSVLKELTGLGQQYKLPPVLVMERGFSQSEVREQFPHYLEADEQNAPTSYALSSNSSLATAGSETLEFLETVLGAIATKILPSSLSMEELLDNIHETLLS